MGYFVKTAILGVTVAFAGATPPPLANVPRREQWGDLDNKRDCSTVGVKVCQMNDTHAKFDNELFSRNPDGTLVKVSHPSEQPEAKPQRLDVISHSTNSTNSNQTPAPVSQKNTSNYETPTLAIILTSIAGTVLAIIREFVGKSTIRLNRNSPNDQIPMQELTRLPSNGNLPNDQIPMQELTRLPSNGNLPVVVNLSSQPTFAPASGASDRASGPLPPSGSPRIEILIPSSSPLASSGLTEVR